MNALTKINELMIKEQCSNIMLDNLESRNRQLERELSTAIANMRRYKQLWIKEQQISNRGE